MSLLEIDTKYLDLIEQACYQTEQFSLMTLELFVVKYNKNHLMKDDNFYYLNYSWGNFFREFLPILCCDFYGNNSHATLLKQEVTLNCLKIAASRDKEDLSRFRNKLNNVLTNFIEPVTNCYKRNIYRIESKVSLESVSHGSSTNLFIYFCLTYSDWYVAFNKEHQLIDLELDSLTDAISVLQKWKNTILLGLSSLDSANSNSSNSAGKNEEINNILHDDSITRPHIYKGNYDSTHLNSISTHSTTDHATNPDVEFQLSPVESTTKELGLGVKVLIAHQSGILNGTFHTLPTEKQYSILALLFKKSRANVKNAITALLGKANSDKNPANNPAVVEETNELIGTKELGIAPVIRRNYS